MFGISFSDITNVAELVLNIWSRWQSAPKDFAALAGTIQLLKHQVETLQHEARPKGRLRLSSKASADAGRELLNRCTGILEKIGRDLDKHRKPGQTGTGAIDWARLKCATRDHIAKWDRKLNRVRQDLEIFIGTIGIRMLAEISRDVHRMANQSARDVPPSGITSQDSTAQNAPFQQASVNRTLMLGSARSASAKTSRSTKQKSTSSVGVAVFQSTPYLTKATSFPNIDNGQGATVCTYVQQDLTQNPRSSPLARTDVTFVNSAAPTFRSPRTSTGPTTISAVKVGAQKARAKVNAKTQQPRMTLQSSASASRTPVPSGSATATSDRSFPRSRPLHGHTTALPQTKTLSMTGSTSVPSLGCVPDSGLRAQKRKSPSNKASAIAPIRQKEALPVPQVAFQQDNHAPERSEPGRKPQSNSTPKFRVPSRKDTLVTNAQSVPSKRKAADVCKPAPSASVSPARRRTNGNIQTMPGSSQIPLMAANKQESMQTAPCSIDRNPSVAVWNPQDIALKLPSSRPQVVNHSASAQSVVADAPTMGSLCSTTMRMGNEAQDHSFHSGTLYRGVVPKDRKQRLTLYLPEGWGVCKIRNRFMFVVLSDDESGRRYFFHPPIRELTPSDLGLPTGWLRVQSPTGRVYWEHRHSGLVIYRHPRQPKMPEIRAIAGVVNVFHHGVWTELNLLDAATRANYLFGSAGKDECQIDAETWKNGKWSWIDNEGQPNASWQRDLEKQEEYEKSVGGICPTTVETAFFDEGSES